MLLKKLFDSLCGIEITDDFYDDLEENLIMADVGARTADELIEELKERVKADKVRTCDGCRDVLKDIIIEKMTLPENAYAVDSQRSVILLVGVNGAGKTTTAGKLAAIFHNDGRNVILAAADTFRAAAIDQLSEWAKRADVDLISSKEGADPGSVVFDACQAAKARGVDILLVDTAGRLHNKANLMAELKKLYGIIDRECSDMHRETLAVLDATTGQNALEQAKQFSEATDLTGIVLTKMDGTAKGGIAVAIQNELGIPVKYIGYGEKIENLKKFDVEEYVNGLM